MVCLFPIGYFACLAGSSPEAGRGSHQYLFYYWSSKLVLFYCIQSVIVPAFSLDFPIPMKLRNKIDYKKQPVRNCAIEINMTNSPLCRFIIRAMNLKMLTHKQMAALCSFISAITVMKNAISNIFIRYTFNTNGLMDVQSWTKPYTWFWFIQFTGLGEHFLLWQFTIWYYVLIHCVHKWNSWLRYLNLSLGA